MLLPDVKVIPTNKKNSFFKYVCVLQFKQLLCEPPSNSSVWIPSTFIQGLFNFRGERVRHDTEQTELKTVQLSSVNTFQWVDRLHRNNRTGERYLKSCSSSAIMNNSANTSSWSLSQTLLLPLYNLTLFYISNVHFFHQTLLVIFGVLWMTPHKEKNV